MAKHSPEANKVRRDLQKELAESAAGSGDELVWSAAEVEIIDLIQAQIDRKTELSAAYTKAADDPKVRCKLSAEMRLLENSIARLLKMVKTEAPPQPHESKRSRNARQAARSRWGA
jgi:hypothetical protein